MGAEVLYWPSFAPSVSARFREREWDPETGRWCEQPIEMWCDRCGDATRYVCSSGEPRKRVNQYAVLHLHQDPLLHDANHRHVEHVEHVGIHPIRDPRRRGK